MTALVLTLLVVALAAAPFLVALSIAMRVRQVASIRDADLDRLLRGPRPPGQEPF